MLCCCRFWVLRRMAPRRTRTARVCSPGRSKPIAGLKARSPSAVCDLSLPSSAGQNDVKGHSPRFGRPPSTSAIALRADVRLRCNIRRKGPTSAARASSEDTKSLRSIGESCRRDVPKSHHLKAACMQATGDRFRPSRISAIVSCGRRAHGAKSTLAAGGGRS